MIGASAWGGWAMITRITGWSSSGLVTSWVMLHGAFWPSVGQRTSQLWYCSLSKLPPWPWPDMLVWARAEEASGSRHSRPIRPDTSRLDIGVLSPDGVRRV